MVDAVTTNNLSSDFLPKRPLLREQVHQLCTKKASPFGSQQLALMGTEMPPRLANQGRRPILELIWSNFLPELYSSDCCNNHRPTESIYEHLLLSVGTSCSLPRFKGLVSWPESSSPEGFRVN